MAAELSNRGIRWREIMSHETTDRLVKLSGEEKEPDQKRVLNGNIFEKWAKYCLSIFLCVDANAKPQDAFIRFSKVCYIISSLVPLISLKYIYFPEILIRYLCLKNLLY